MKRLMVVMGLLFLALPIFAQEALTETELEWLAYVQTAMNNTVSVESYTASGSMSMSQQIVPSQDAQGMTEINQIIDQTMNGQIAISAAGDIAVNITIDQSINMTMPGIPETNITQTLDIIVVDKTLYMRFSNLSAELANVFPEGWVNLNDDPDAFPGSNVIVADQYTEALQANLALNLTEDLVLNITEREETELAGQKLRVFEVEINAPALFATDTMGTALSMFDFSAFGVDVEDAQAVFGEKMQMTLILHIGVDDELVHYQESYVKIVEVDMSKMLNQTAPVYLSQEITTIITYTDFNAPVSIAAPSEE
jgi:hypothetical protein